MRRETGGATLNEGTQARRHAGTQARRRLRQTQGDADSNTHTDHAFNLD